MTKTNGPVSENSPRRTRGDGDIIIVGAGLAGLFTALKLAPLPVTVVSAAPFGQGGSSVWAQAGIAAALAEGDSPEAHAADTIGAGAGIVDEKIALLLAREARDRVEDLLRYGVPFDKDLEGQLDLAREAAHGARRVLHVKGDTAGRAIMAALTAAARATPSIQVLEGWTARDLVIRDGRVAGVKLARVGPGPFAPSLALDASAVVLATGFDHFDSRRKFEYGYGRYPDVLDFKELEGMIHDDKVLRPSDGKPPRRIAWILCVGSRDLQVGNPWCCRMGCAVSIKQAVEIRQKHPEIDAYVYYMDIRTYGLWEDLYWKSMDEYGVKFIRGRIGQVTMAEGGSRLLATGEDTILSRPTEVPFDMIVLASGMEPGTGTKEAATLFGLPVGPEGFLTPRLSDMNPVDSGVPGIYFAGAATGPKAIPDAVTEGMGAALRAYQYARE